MAGDRNGRSASIRCGSCFPKLIEAGAVGIIEFPLNKIIN